MNSLFANSVASPQSAQADLSAENVIKFPSRGVPPPPGGSDGTSNEDHLNRSQDRFHRMLFGISGTLIVTTVVFALFASNSPSLRIYHTKVGEQLPVSLPNGTEALLNTDSVLRVWRTGSEWHTDLLKGEAFFARTSAARKYSRITIRDAEITAAQSEFTARTFESGGSQITVATGSVSVSSFNMYQRVIYSDQRALFRYSDHAEMFVESLSDVEIRRQLSWRYGALQFSHTAISTAVSEINRYNRTQIDLSGGFGTMKIDGIFSLTDPFGFARTVSRLDRNIVLNVDESIPDHIVLKLIRPSTHGKPSRQNPIQHQRGSDQTL